MALRPVARGGGSGDPSVPAEFSFVVNSTRPLDRTAPAFHRFGDVSLRFSVGGGAYPRSGWLPNASIHCTDGTGDCIVATFSGTDPTGCAARCAADPSTTRCAAWSWGRAPVPTCFLLTNATDPPSTDPNAECGWEPGWAPGRGGGGGLDVSTATIGASVAVPAIPAADEVVAQTMPLQPIPNATLRRAVAVDAQSGDIVLRYSVTNNGAAPLNLTAFGLSVVGDQIFTGRTLEQIGREASFTDPAMLGQHGYVQLVSTTGRGPVMLILPDGAAQQPPGPRPSFEAWRMLREDPTPRSVTFEGFYSLMTHSAGYAASEWASGAGPLNRPTWTEIAPGATHRVAFRLALAVAGLEGGVDTELLNTGRAVVSAVPGFVLTPEMANASLRVRAPHGLTLVGASVDPNLSPDAPGLSLAVGPPSTAGGDGDEVEVPVWCTAAAAAAAGDGARQTVTLTFSDSTTAFAHFFVIPEPARARVRRYGAALSTRYHYTDGADPFHRAPAFMNVDARESGGVILQSDLAWIAGLSDEAGAGPAVGLAAKSLADPDPAEVTLLAGYVAGTLWGTPEARAAGATVQRGDYGVRASMFFSGLPGFNYTCHPCWDEPRALTTWRSYNYPHVTSVYRALYRLARLYGAAVALPQSWQWYLGQAANTTLLGAAAHGTYNEFGLMVGSVWVALLDDLVHEAAFDPAGPWRQLAEAVDGFMRGRAAAWAALPFPFGSEMPWDSTGQEEVYTWCRRYGLFNASNATLDAVLAYSPRVAGWAYRGNARRYFDFGPWSGRQFVGNEREFHHYGAPLNALVTLEAYRAAPDRTHLLDVGLAGAVGTLTNIRGSGVASMAWHGDPASMDHDPYDFDFGVGFYGHAANVGSFVLERATGAPPSAVRGGQYDCYWANCRAGGGGGVVVAPVDSFRRRVYLAPIGLDVVVQGGAMRQLVYAPDARTIVAEVVHAAVVPLNTTVELACRAHPLCGGMTFACRGGGTLVASAARVECTWPPGNNTEVTVQWRPAA